MSNRYLLDLDTTNISREELREKIRETSEDEVLDAEMKRLGFWDPDNPPEGEAELGELNREIAVLKEQLAELKSDYTDRGDALERLKKAREERMAASKLRREENKLRREAARIARHEEWQRQRGEDIYYVGEDYSADLSKGEEQVELLASNGLTSLPTHKALAELLGLSVYQLRFLAFTRPVSRYNHYQRFAIPKKTGGERIISAPQPLLKAAQHAILEQIVSKVALHEAAHGFVPQRSILTNALPHVGAKIVLNLDLKDFFPTFNYRRVKGLFVSLGFSRSTATLLALLSTEPQIQAAELDGERWYLANGERFLPQGAPTSPAITNLICRKLDVRLSGLAASLGATYTRYADDLTFSSNDEEFNVGRFIQAVHTL